jgi:hypothetical protein
MLPATYVAIAITHIIAVAIAINIIAVAHPPPSSPSLLPLSPLPSLLHATLVANAIAHFAAHHP